MAPPSDSSEAASSRSESPRNLDAHRTHQKEQLLLPRELLHEYVNGDVCTGCFNKAMRNAVMNERLARGGARNPGARARRRKYAV